MATGNGGVCWQCHFVAGCERGHLERGELEYVKISCRILTHQKWLFWGPGPFYTVSNSSIGGSNITGSDFGATPRFRSNLDSGMRGLIWIIAHFLVSLVAWARKNSTWGSVKRSSFGDMILGFVYITWFFTSYHGKSPSNQHLGWQCLLFQASQANPRICIDVLNNTHWLCERCERRQFMYRVCCLVSFFSGHNPLGCLCCRP